MKPAIFASEAKRKAGETLETWSKSSAGFVRLVAVERQGLPALAANGVSLGKARCFNPRDFRLYLATHTTSAMRQEGLVSVPSCFYRAGDPGNERLLAVERGSSRGRPESYHSVRKANNTCMKLALVLTSMNSDQSGGQAARKVPK